MYDIIRFYESGRKRLIHSCVTLQQAQEWCKSPLTRKSGVYFDGYDDHGRHGRNLTAMYSHYFAPDENYH